LTEKVRRKKPYLFMVRLIVNYTINPINLLIKADCI